MDFYYQVYSQKELFVHRYEGMQNGEFIRRVGWLDTRGRVNLVMPDGEVRRFWRRPWQIHSVMQLGSLQNLPPWRWKEFVEWARKPSLSEFPSEDQAWEPHDDLHPHDGCICRVGFKQSDLSAYGVICLGRFFTPHVADEDAWWPVEIRNIKLGENLFSVQSFLDMELQNDLLRLVRGLPETMDEIRARMTVMSI